MTSHPLLGCKDRTRRQVTRVLEVRSLTRVLEKDKNLFQVPTIRTVSMEKLLRRGGT